MTLKINNRDARRLWLHAHGLSHTPNGALDVLQIIKDLGFVQIDSIRNVTRAHHHILWTRNQNYREPMLWALLSEERMLFEHFTHDASLIPIEFYPMWQRQFKRMKNRLDAPNFYRHPPSPQDIHAIKLRVRNEGSLCTRAFTTQKPRTKEMWSRPPHKLALDYMWYIGELTTSHRENFTKFYDLSERIIPLKYRRQKHSNFSQIDWLCSNALRRLGIANLREIQHFWDATTLGEVKDWVAQAQSKIRPVNVQSANGEWHSMLSPADIESRIAEAIIPTTRLRIINPFDPVIRDRKRLLRLFGFEYRIEIFVPASKRKWGYYVYPLLEGDKFVGRVELKANRKSSILTVENLWPEFGVKWSKTRRGKLSSELARFARLIGVQTIEWKCSRNMD